MTIRELTRLGTSPRKIARLLQAKAPEGHILAYITPEEADVLKARGGSGHEHEDTGIPSYEMEGELLPEQPGVGGDVPEGEMPIGPSVSTTPFEFGGEPQPTAAPPTGPADLAGYTGFRPGETLTPPPTPQAPSLGVPERAAGGGAPKEGDTLSKEALARLGIGGLEAVLGARQARQAAAQGQAAKGEMQRVAAPYQQMGQQLVAQAQRGELTPQAQQSLQAVQARAAQQATQQGGVGVAQAQQATEAFRQQLLQQQADYGLKLSNIGDQIALGAIRAGVQADQYVNQLTSSYYNNIARTLAGQPLAGTPTAQPAPTGG